MMKVLTLTALLASSLSFASPSVGDSATYRGTIVIMGTVVDFEKKTELTDYDSERDMFKQIEETKNVQEGNVDVVEAWVNRDDLASDFSTEEAMKNCSQIDGKIVTITVAAGQFESCEIAAEGSRINVGRVPFELLRIDSNEFKIELISFRRGEN